jgi:hypothetical protein
VVVRTQRRAVPGALLQHLRNGRVVQIEPVLDGIAATVQCSMQPDASVRMAGDFLPPAMSFIDDGLEFFDGERGLRDQLAILANPGAMSHVYLDPIGSVIQLLARRFAGLDRSVDELRAFWHIQFGSVTFQHVAASRGYSARDHE